MTNIIKKHGHSAPGGSAVMARHSVAGYSITNPATRVPFQEGRGLKNV